MGNMGQKWRRRYWRRNKLAPRWQGLWFLFGCFVGRGNRWATQTNVRLIHPGNGYGLWLFHSKQLSLVYCRFVVCALSEWAPMSSETQTTVKQKTISSMWWLTKCPPLEWSYESWSQQAPSQSSCVIY